VAEGVHVKSVVASAGVVGGLRERKGQRRNGKEGEREPEEEGTYIVAAHVARSSLELRNSTADGVGAPTCQRSRRKRRNVS
jgi:hypothetical protein